VFGESDGYAVWESVNQFFDTLPLAAAIDDTIFCVHGGIPRALCRPGSSLDLIRQMPCPLRCVQAGETVYDMLWSDPSSPEQEMGNQLDASGFGQSARGCTCFSERSIALFLEMHGFKHVFRGHEAQQSGIGVSKNSQLTTIFSTSKDHFSGDITSTCGCVLVDHGTIHPIVRALPAVHVGVKPTYAAQSIEATEAPPLPPPPAYAGLTGIGSTQRQLQLPKLPPYREPYEASPHAGGGYGAERPSHGSHGAHGAAPHPSSSSSAQQHQQQQQQHPHHPSSSQHPSSAHLFGERQAPSAMLYGSGGAGGAGGGNDSEASRQGVNSWLEEAYNMRLRSNLARPVPGVGE
ncbi:Metallo-dependent phosphatase-like protein, partial [Baffinella frigidus]